MKRLVITLIIIPIFFLTNFIMGADGVNNVIDNNIPVSLDFLPDSIKGIVSNKKFIIYDYGHHGKNWCLIYEEAGSYKIQIGTTRNELPNLALKIDTANLINSYSNLICWGMDTLPYITRDMVRKYPKQWSVFYRSLSVFDQQSNCIFNSDNAIGFEGFDNTTINEKFSKLSYLMYWLSAPKIRHLLPGFEDYTQKRRAEDYYVSAFKEMSDMLAGRDSLSIKRAVFLAEWAYYDGKLDYKTDFCDEIDRIKKFIRSVYEVNKLHTYKTGMQMAISSYMVSPFSGNNYMPYTYDFETFSKDNEPLDLQFVTKTLKTHKGQCRSLPWMYKILANDLKADVSLAHAPRHSYIMYKDEDKITPEEWINLELTTNQMNPSWWIKQDFEICDSAVIVGTYMTPLTDIQTVACQMSDLAFGYWTKFHRYDEFTFYCSSRSLEFYPMNPNALIIRGKSLEQLIQNYLMKNNNIIDDYCAYLIGLMEDTKWRLDKTYMTEETKEIRERRKQQAIEAQKYIQK